MAEHPLTQTVYASVSKRSWRGSALSFLTSILLQGLTIAALIVTPLLAFQSLPEPASRQQLPQFVPAAITIPRVRVRRLRPPTTRKITVPPRPIATGFTFVDLDDLGANEAGVDDWGSPEGVPGGVILGLFGNVSAPPAEPVPDVLAGPIAVGGDVLPPRKIVHVNPIYPTIARAAHIEGTVRLRAILDAEGNVVEASIIESVPLLDAAALEAVRRWKYEPTYLNGRSVPVSMSVSIEFRLR